MTRRAALVVLVVCWFSPVVSAQHNMLTGAEEADGWTLLFDGASLNGWSPRVDARGGHRWHDQRR